MRAVVLTGGDPDAPTGGSLYHRRIADRAPRFGVRVELCSLDRDPDPGRLVSGADVVVVDSIVAARVDASALRRPFVASVHQRPGGLVGSFAGRIADAVRDVRRYRAAHAVVVPSRFLASTVRRRGVAAERIRVVEPGCPPRRARADARTARDGVSFVCVANLAGHKRPLDLLDAFASLADLDASLTLAGGAPDAELAVRTAVRLAAPDLVDRARWLGPLVPGEVEEVVGRADVFVLPALHESYGMAVAEALRAGVPAVVARSGNLPNLVLDGVDGYVVPARDPGALAQAMRRLAVDPVRRRAMSAAAFARSARFPTWDDATRRFCSVLRSVQGSGGGVRSPAV